LGPGLLRLIDGLPFDLRPLLFGSAGPAGSPVWGATPRIPFLEVFLLVLLVVLISLFLRYRDRRRRAAEAPRPGPLIRGGPKG